jgi:hypothetical protein
VTPEQDGGPPKPPSGKDKPAPVEVLDVVKYIHRDPLLVDGERPELGVVVGVDEHGVDVVPLAGHSVRVGVDEVARLTADSLG